MEIPLVHCMESIFIRLQSDSAGLLKRDFSVLIKALETGPGRGAESHGKARSYKEIICVLVP